MVYGKTETCQRKRKKKKITGSAEAYLDLLLGRGGATQFFSLIQVQNLQVKFLIILKSGESLIIVILI
jgi:hypothetical protein